MRLSVEKALTESSLLAQAEDLVTPQAEVRAGFVAMAMEKNRQGTPILAEARALKTVAESVAQPSDLPGVAGLERALLTASGLSDKAAKHLLPQDKTDAIQGLITNFLEPTGGEWANELVYRYLLTRGDTLGGAMRNIAGALGERKFITALLASLRLNGAPYFWQHAKLRQWAAGADDDTDIEGQLNGLAWQVEGEPRTLLFNVGVPVVGKNVDLCLLQCNPETLHSSAQWRTLLRDPASYIVLGELKSGIDPAGADEHWKTARTALVRVRETFGTAGFAPATFFIGAAIVPNMAREIWTQLQVGTLSRAANLTHAGQLAALCRWLATR